MLDISFEDIVEMLEGSLDDIIHWGQGTAKTAVKRLCFRPIVIFACDILETNYRDVKK